MEWIINTDDDYRAAIEIIRVPFLFAQECCNIELLEFQDNIWDNLFHNQYSLNIAGRQIGKTTLALLYIYWYVTNNSNKTVIVSGVTEHAAKAHIAQINKWIETGPTLLKHMLANHTSSQLQFHNGSKIVSRACTARNFRGWSINLLFLDDFAYVPVQRQSEVLSSVLPAIVAGSGKVIISTTPQTKHDSVYALYNNSQWSTTITPVSEYRDQAWIDNQRLYMSDELFKCDYECEFRD